MVIDEQTNKVYFSSWLPQTCPKLWTELQKVLRDNKVDTALLNCTNDIWCRDFMPIQIAPDKMVFYDYNPDYLQRKKKYITNTKMLASMFIRVMPKVSIKYLKLIIDGGNVVKCGDTIVMTEKVFHENKEYSREDIVEMLRCAFECDIIFLPWDRSEPYGHSDGIIHYLGNKKVLLTNYDDFDSEYYHQFKIILEQKFEVIPLHYHLKEKHIDNWCYINYLHIGNLIIVPQLGIPEDGMAIEQIQKALPDAKVVGVPATEAVKDGGALNCLSWNIDASEAQMVPENSYDKEYYLDLLNKIDLETIAFKPYFDWIENRVNLPSTDYMNQLLRYIDNSRKVTEEIMDAAKSALNDPELLSLPQKIETREDIKHLECQIVYTNLLLNAILCNSLQIEDANKFSSSNALVNTINDIERIASQYYDIMFPEEEFDRFYIETVLPPIHDCPF